MNRFMNEQHSNANENYLLMREKWKKTDRSYSRDCRGFLSESFRSPFDNDENTGHSSKSPRMRLG